MVDGHQLARITDFVADGGLDYQLTTRLQPEAYFVEHTARHPAILGDPRYRRETHTGEFTDQIQNAGHRVDLSDIAYVQFEVSRQAHRDVILFEWSAWPGV
jgi:hypothetical protein